MISIRRIKNILEPITHLPIHPQWLMRFRQKNLIFLLGDIGDDKTVLDIGCYNKWTQRFISKNCRYLGIDYLYTAKNWYQSRPDIYGDALALPIGDETIDTILLLDVLEHLSDTNLAITEIHRILKIGGTAIIQIPFLYPIHDAPQDFSRYTIYGLQNLAIGHNLEVESSQHFGHSLETAALLCNISLSKTLYNWLTNKNLWAILGLTFPFIFMVNNLLAKAFSYIAQQDTTMPHSYQLVFKKKA